MTGKKYQDSLTLKSKITLNSYLFFIYILLFPLVIINYFLNVLGFFYLPAGSLAYLLSLILIAHFIMYELKLLRDISLIYFLFFIAFLSSILAILVFSAETDFLDSYNFFKIIIYFIMGFYFYKLFKSEYYLKYYLFFAFFSSVGIIILYNSIDIYDVAEKQINYLQIAEALVVILLVAHSAINKKINQYILFLLGIGSLYFINSRSSIAGYIITFMLLMFLKYSKKHFIALISVLSLFTATYLVDYAIKADATSYNRMFRIFVNTDNDNSLNARKQLHEQGMSRISEHTFTGDFKGQLEYGGFGSYMHDIFSFWAQFGLVNFILIILLIIFGYIIILKNWQNNFYKNFTLIYFTYTVLLTIVAKAYIYNQIYLSFGLVLAMSLHTFPIIGRKKK